MQNRHRIRAELLFGLCLVVLAVSVASARDTVDLESFHDALGRALNSNRIFEDSEYSSGRTEIQGTANALLPDSGPWGVWRLEPRGHFEIEGYGAKTVFSNGGVAVVTNRGVGYDYVLQTQPIPPLLLERVLERVGDRLEGFRENPAPAAVEWVVRDGHILLAASHDWNGDANVARLEDQLDKLLMRSKLLIGKIVEEVWRGRRDLVGELEGRTHTSLGRAEFELLVDEDDWSPWFLGTEAAAAGAYRFHVQDELYEVRNHGDRLEFIHVTAVPATMGEHERTTLLQAAAESVAGMKAEDDPDVSVAWSDDGAADLWIRLVYDLSGGVKGERIPRWYKKLWEDYGPEAGKRMAKLLEGLRAEQDQARPTSLDRDAFLRLVDDGLEELEGTEGAGPGGSWDFVLADEFDLEVHNRGDAMELWLNEQLPAAGEGSEILAAVQDAVGDRRPKHADSVHVEWYPGSDETWIVVRVVCRYDGARKGEQIHDCYHDFVYEWCRDIHGRIGKVFERFEE